VAVPKRLVERVLTAAVREFEFQVDRSIQQNFRVGGRPRWDGLKHRKGVPLQKSGVLARAVIVKSYVGSGGKYNILVRTNNVPYARIHQFGGVIRPTRAKALAIPLTDKARKMGSPKNWPEGTLFKHKGEKSFTLCEKVGKKGKLVAHYVLLKSVKIPGRPYVMVQAEDVKVFSQIVRRNLKAEG
jgi:phage gpG-like protein